MTHMLMPNPRDDWSTTPFLDLLRERAMKDHAQTLIHSSVEPCYRTPPALFAALDAEFHFTVDAAASQESALCDWWYGPGAPHGLRDGLTYSWHMAQVEGIARPHFCNPPYSRTRMKELKDTGAPQAEINAFDIRRWAEKCAVEGEQLIVVALLPAAIQTGWWQACVWEHAHEIRFFPRRLTFLEPDGTPCENVAGVNHAVVIWRPDPGYVGIWQPTIRYWDYR